MIKVKPLETGIMQVKSTVRLVHPKTNLMTIQIGHDAHCNFPLTVELALSDGYHFLTDQIPEFNPYGVLIDDAETMTYYNMRSSSHTGMVMTYRHVPIATLAKFLNIYAEKN